MEKFNRNYDTCAGISAGYGMYNATEILYLSDQTKKPINPKIH